MSRLVSDRANRSRDCNLCPAKSNGERMDTTSQFDASKLGTLIQSYARARWYAGPEKQEAVGLETQLERGLRDRIDALGADIERLLLADPADALSELEALEHEAAMEDAGAKLEASRLRAREEMQIHGETETSRRNHRVHAGGYSQPARHGRRGQRGER